MANTIHKIFTQFQQSVEILCKSPCIFRVKNCVYPKSARPACVKTNFPTNFPTPTSPTFPQPHHPYSLTIFSTIPQPLLLQLRNIK